jgi:hypothetical protein
MLTRMPDTIVLISCCSPGEKLECGKFGETSAKPLKLRWSWKLAARLQLWKFALLSFTNSTGADAVFAALASVLRKPSMNNEHITASYHSLSKFMVENCGRKHLPRASVL